MSKTYRIQLGIAIFQEAFVFRARSIMAVDLATRTKRTRNVNAEADPVN